MMLIRFVPFQLCAFFRIFTHACTFSDIHEMFCCRMIVTIEEMTDSTLIETRECDEIASEMIGELKRLTKIENEDVDAQGNMLALLHFECILFAC